MSEFFMKRKRTEEGYYDYDVYSYDEVPSQALNVMKIAFRKISGMMHSMLRSTVLEHVINALVEEDEFSFNSYELMKNEFYFERDDFLESLMVINRPDLALSIYELMMGRISELMPDFNELERHALKSDLLNDSKSILRNLNESFKRFGFGYEYIEDSNMYIKIADDINHKTVVSALKLLHEEEFEGANDEYMKAHSQFRLGNYKDCMTGCGRAFESTMKTILSNNGWSYDSDRDTASKLVEALKSNDFFIGLHLDGTISGLSALLKTQVPTPRNRVAGHGQGPDTVQIAPHYAEYLLSTTAAVIVLLVRHNIARNEE